MKKTEIDNLKIFTVLCKCFNFILYFENIKKFSNETIFYLFSS